MNETVMATATSHDIISPVTTEKPELIVSAPSINSEPVELDSTPASPDKVRTRRASRDELLAELDGEEKEKRNQLLLERKSDPAVLVDIPKTPGADELEKGASILNKKSLWSVMHLGPLSSSYGN